MAAEPPFPMLGVDLDNDCAFTWARANLSALADTAADQVQQRRWALAKAKKIGSNVARSRAHVLIRFSARPP